MRALVFAHDFSMKRKTPTMPQHDVLLSGLIRHY